MWEGEWEAEPIAYRQRNITRNVIQNGRIVRVEVIGRVLSWESDYVNTLDPEQTIHGSLSSFYQDCVDYWECGGEVEYFTVDPSTRARCFPSGGTPSPTSLNGRSSPPPKRKKEMCCPCDVIATMIERSMAEKARQSELIKNHIDQRFIEALKNINQQLGAIQIDLDLDPVIQEIRQARTDLWNGVGGKD